MTSGSADTASSVVVTTPPSVEPVTLAEAKLHLRVTHNLEDDLITSLIVAAREWAENQTRRRFVNTTQRLSYDEFPDEFILPGGRTQSITSITYTDTNGATQTLATSVYTVITDSEPGRIVRAYNQLWPATRSIPNAVQVVQVAGYGSAASNVPDSIKAAMKLAIGNWFENRESTISGTIINEIPMAAQALLDPFRIPEFF